MQVVVGSLNRAKVEAVRSVFRRAWPDCRVIGQAVDVPDSVSAMPIGEQIRLGARFRAQAALGPGVDIGVGAEGGVQFEGSKAYLLNWCAIAHHSGAVYESPSPYVLLPDAFASAIRQGQELGPYLAALTGMPHINQEGGAVGLLTRGLLERQEFFEQTLLCALAPILSPEWYGSTASPQEPT